MAGGTWTAGCVAPRISGRVCVFLNNSGITGVWKAAQFSWLTRPFASQVWKCCQYWDFGFVFPCVHGSLFTSQGSWGQLTPSCYLHPHTFAVIVNYSCHPLMGGEHFNTLYLFCSSSTVVIRSWGLYIDIYLLIYIQLSNLIISY